MRFSATNPASWVALVLAATLLAGCGGERPPAEAAPELADRLTLVDRAVASGDETSIRRRVESLVAAAESARDDGLIDDVQEDRILVAARALLAQLPDEPAPEPTPSESPTPTPSPTPKEDDGEEEGSGPGNADEDDSSGNDKDKGQGKGKGKGKGNGGDEGGGDD
jgi:hypothetical protein